MALKAVTFDFWYTLFRDANGAARQQLRIDGFSKATGVPIEETAAALKVVWAEFERTHREEQRTLRPENAIQIAARELGITVEPEDERHLAKVFGEAILAHSAVPIEGAVEAVRAAAVRGPVGLVSDTGVSPGHCLRKLMDRHEFSPSFATMVFSDEVGVSKPQAAMFEAAAAGLGVAMEELLHIGDLEFTDIVGAQALGAKAALFAGANDTHREDTRADYVFDTWDEFIDRLPDITG
ncbi:MAG: HAD-IA family hydrolase [Nitrospiraceae bacterium]|nr:HAD-IA family hydrolase [Nitrospiraceae bacterium]